MLLVRRSRPYAGLGGSARSGPARAPGGEIMGGDSESVARHRRAVIAWWRSFGVVVLLAALVAGAGACGESDSGDASGDAQSGGQGSAAASDSFMKGYVKAQEAMAGTAGDAVLIAGGTSGLAFADVPDSWTYSFFSPGNRHVYRVEVEHGTVGEPRDLGEGAADNEIVDSLDAATHQGGCCRGRGQGPRVRLGERRSAQERGRRGHLRTDAERDRRRPRDGGLVDHVRDGDGPRRRTGVHGRHDDRRGGRGDRVGEAPLPGCRLV